MSIPANINPFLLAAAAVASPVQIERSLRFNSSDSAYLSRTPSSAGNRRTWTLSLWVKRANLGAQQKLLSVNTASDNGNAFNIDFDSSDRFSITASSGGADILTLTTTQVFRDVSAWYHILLSVDTTQSTASNRLKLYANGQQVTIFTTASYPAPNADLRVNNNEVHYIGRLGYTSVYCNAYLADIHLIDGSALDPSSFTEVSATTGQLIPKAYTGTFTGNSFWLKFSDNSSTTSGSNVGIGKDFSGLGNYWNSTNLSVTAGAGNDSLVDTPTSYGTGNSGGDVRGNYATLNPLDRSSNVTLANGNLDWSNSSAGNVRGTVSFNGGKFYCEATASTPGSYGFGIGKASSSLSGNFGAGITGVYAWRWNGTVYFFHSSGSEPWSASGSSSDVLQIAIDASNSASVKLFLGRQNTWYDSSGGTTANPATGANPTATLTDNVDWFLFTGGGNISNAVSVNFGQRPFAYAAPSGFKALVDTNLTAPVIAKPNQHFDAITYNGNGSTLTLPNANSTPTSITFDPGFIWFKQRSSPKRDNNVYDVIRGTTKLLSTNGHSGDASTYDVYPGDGTEQTVSGLTAFNTGSKTVDIGSSNVANGNGASYIAWCWDAGSDLNPTTINANAYSAGVPSITSQVRANVSAGFSIVSVPGYTYPTKTAGHGLGVEPHFIITKNRGVSNPWIIYHKAAGVNTYFQFDTGAGYTGVPGVWSGVNSTVFPINSGVNQQTDIIAYCFAPVTGYSSMGSYVGNGSSDGPAVWLGFRPKWLLIKRTDSANDWYLQDSARDPYNPCPAGLFPNLSAAEDSSYRSAYPNDMLSNGFKLRTSNAGWNASGGTYLYIAFAESPFQYARAR